MIVSAYQFWITGHSQHNDSHTFMMSQSAENVTEAEKYVIAEMARALGVTDHEIIIDTVMVRP